MNPMDQMEPMEQRISESCDLSLPAPTPRASLAARLIAYILSGLRHGSVAVQFQNGYRQRFHGSEAGPHGELRILREGALALHVMRGGEVGFGDAYLDHCWTSPDLTQLMMVLNLNEPYYKGPFQISALGRLFGLLQHRLRDNTRRVARRNIEHHYDLGNDFYETWLDPTMAYSSAIFQSPEQSLEDAQINKFRLMYDRLDLAAGHELLEIGSGWGGFAIYAAQRSGCRVHSITLSSEQLQEARTRAAAAGLADRVTFELLDYRDLSRRYDRVVSIEMYEAVGEAFWPSYFATIAKALKPGGRAAIQGITIAAKTFEAYRLKRDFLQKYIFPGGMLCPPERFAGLARGAGLTPLDAKFFAIDYADTLVRWRHNVEAVRDRIVERFDERFLRMWHYYLSYCECGFRSGNCDLMQITLQAPPIRG